MEGGCNGGSWVGCVCVCVRVCAWLCVRVCVHVCRVSNNLKCQVPSRVHREMRNGKEKCLLEFQEILNVCNNTIFLRSIESAMLHVHFREREKKRDRKDMKERDKVCMQPTVSLDAYF